MGTGRGVTGSGPPPYGRLASVEAEHTRATAAGYPRA